LQITALFVFITSYYPDKRIKKNIMGTAYGMYIGRGRGGGHEWKRVPARTTIKWEYSVKMNFKEMCLERVDWMLRARDRDIWRRLL